MAFWNSSKPVYDRARTFEAAEKARLKGKTNRAIVEYRKILAVDPNDAQVGSKLAPLLVKAGRKEEAAKVFETTAEAFIAKGFVDKALAVYALAASHFPMDSRLWIRTAELTAERGRKADAVKTLLQGAGHLARGRKTRETALELIIRALSLDPLHIPATIDYAKVLKKLGRKKEGLERLDALAERIRGPAVKKIRAAQLRLSPSPLAIWRWLRSGSAAATKSLPPTAGFSGPVTPPASPTIPRVAPHANPNATAPSTRQRETVHLPRRTG